MRAKRANMWMNILFTIFLILTFIVLLVTRAEGAQDPLSTSDPEPTWTLLDKLAGDESELKTIPLKIGKTIFRWREERIFSIDENGMILSKSVISLSDVEREIALQLLNLETGETEIVKVHKRGRDLLVPSSYDIRVVKRVNGIEWNGRNTHYNVIEPENTIVIKMAWPTEGTCTILKEGKDKKGRVIQIKKNTKCITNVVYSPYSGDDPMNVEIENGIHTPELVMSGTLSINSIFEEARQRLRDNQVYSRAFPDYIVGDVPFIDPKAYPRIVMTEHMDLAEFNYNPRISSERVLVILGANPGRAFSTCNSSKKSRACGIGQFTDRWRGRNPGTYSAIVRAYPRADLIKNFPAGAFDHVNAAMATILLHDYNLAVMVNKFGQQFIDKVMSDPIFTELILSASYNGSPSWVHLALGATASNNYDGWTEARNRRGAVYLRIETQGYIKKELYLIGNNLP